MPIELISAAPGFDDPLGLISACHGRITAQCATLMRLPEHLKIHGSDEQAMGAANRILNYFNTAGKHHHQDEEIDLFPLLATLAAEDGNTLIVNTIQELQAEHTAIESLWLPLAFTLAQISDRQYVILETLSVEKFVNLQRSHIIKEDDFIFSYARQKLTPAQIFSLGFDMATRRNISVTKNNS